MALVALLSYKRLVLWHGSNEGTMAALKQRMGMLAVLAQGTAMALAQGTATRRRRGHGWRGLEAVRWSDYVGGWR